MKNILKVIFAISIMLVILTGCSVRTHVIMDIKANKTKVAGYEALSVSAYYPEQAKYLTTWFFETKSGYTHYLAIECPEKDGDNYNIIYSFKEDE